MISFIVAYHVLIVVIVTTGLGFKKRKTTCACDMKFHKDIEWVTKFMDWSFDILNQRVKGPYHVIRGSLLALFMAQWLPPISLIEIHWRVRQHFHERHCLAYQIARMTPEEKK